jgi:ATP-dependent helicase/nuclease subunit B
VDILVHAPAARAADFDDWGRPRPPLWANAVIDIPDTDRNLLLGANPADQARLVLARIAQEADRLGPADLAIGVPDAEVTPYLETLLAERDLTAFDPAGQPLSRHRVYQLLERCHALLVDPSYPAVSSLLRHPDILRALHDGFAVHAGDLLDQLDRFQNKHLPQNLADLRRRLPAVDAPTPLHTALEFIDQLTACATRAPAPPVSSLEDAVAALMTLVYANQTIDPHVPEEALFQRVAQRINRLTAEARLSLFQTLHGSLQESLQLVLHALANDTVYKDRKDAGIDLEGWLELPWNNARLLVVTGMNEGRVPDSRMSDAFLPDRLRAQWGLRCDADRLARDAYLMTALIESRRADGGTAFIAGACSSAGDPLRPSRLLFRCPDALLPERAARLFREPPPPQPAHPVSVSFTLNPHQGEPPNYPETISVTAFSSYLACPFRFYLSHVRKMEELTDDKAELDALDFGSITHYALQGLETMPTEDREQTLTACFLKRAESALRHRFGRRPPFPVTMQFESIQQRLIAAAAVQARLAQEGWIPRYFEQPVETQIGSLTVRGKIDRADFHPDLKAWRIIDYKTIDTPQPPAGSHIGSARADAPDYALLPARRGRPQQWRDLQLPLYAVLVRTLAAEGPVTVGHFHLPRAVTSTGLQLWEDLSDDLVQSAWTCARGVVGDIERRLFWPAAPSVEYDAFASLFPRPPAETVQPPVPP